MRKFLILIGILSILGSCNKNKEKKTFLPSSTGAVNSVMVVMEDDLWQGAVGDYVRDVFAQPCLGLSPVQPIFTLQQVPPSVFKGAIRNSRSILFIAQDTLSINHVKSNVYAMPQKVAVIKGANYNELVSNVQSIAQEAIAAFKQTELIESQKRFKRSLNKENALEQTFGIAMTIPSAYKVGKQEKNFVWLDRQIPKGTMNIIAYTMPMNSFKNDSTFVKDIVRMRDSIGKKYVPGPYDNTYMMTEKAFAPYVFPSEIGGKKGVEVKGIWEINGYPMAGPF